MLVPLAAALSCTITPAAVAGGPDLGLQQIVKAQAGIHTLEGRFTQTKTLSLFDETIVSEGTIVIEKPDFYCWIYGEPEPRLFYVDGRRSGTFEPESGTRNEVNLDSTGLTSLIQSVSSIISGSLQPSALSEYEVVRQAATDDFVTYTFTPLTEQGESLFQQVTIGFDPRTGLARDLEITESNGDRSVMTFDDWQRNVAVDRTQLLGSLK